MDVGAVSRFCRSKEAGVSADVVGSVVSVAVTVWAPPVPLAVYVEDDAVPLEPVVRMH